MKFHIGLLRRAIPFEIIAPRTCTHQILPRVSPAHGSGNHMVNGHRPFHRAAVLASMAVTSQDVLPRKHYLFVWDPSILPQADN